MTQGSTLDNAATTVSELAAHGATGTHTIRLDLNLTSASLLDLTSPTVAKMWNYTGGSITPATQAIGENALAAGFDVIKFPSLRGPGTNFAVIDNFSKLLTPQMISPTP